MCIDAPETVQCIAARCTMQAGAAFIESHNWVTVIVLWHIFANYGLEVPKSQWDKPMKVFEKNKYKMAWDFKHWQTATGSPTVQPDRVVVDKE